MKRFLAAAVTALSLAFATPSLAQTPPNVLVVGQIAEPKSLDPHAVTAVNDFRILMNVYDGLVRYKDGTLEVEPSLAKSWTISDDGTVYTFKLRDGVKFMTVRTFNAEAVKFNFDRMLDENHPYHDTGPFPLSFFFSSVDSVTSHRRPDRRVQAEGALRTVPVEPGLSDRSDRLARGGEAIRLRIRPPSLRHRRLQVRRVGGQFEGRRDPQRGLLGWRAIARGDHLPADYRRQHAHRRDALRRSRHHGRGAAGQPGPVPHRRVLHRI